MLCRLPIAGSGKVYSLVSLSLDRFTRDLIAPRHEHTVTTDLQDIDKTTMSLRTWESSHTHHAWSTTASPIVLLLVCLVANIIALIVSIVINVTSANEPGNDYGPG